jgi:putative transposase
MTQIWIAMCAYLLLAWIKFSSQIDRSLQQMIRLLQLNLFEILCSEASFYAILG